MKLQLNAKCENVNNRRLESKMSGGTLGSASDSKVGGANWFRPN